MIDATTGALIVAALGVLAGPVTAWLSFRWGRKQEADRRDHERAMETDRARREDRNRRLLRGEEAAGKLLELVNSAQTRFNAAPVAQHDMKDTYTEVRRLAELLTDPSVRDRMFEVARGLYFFEPALEFNENLTRYNVAYVCSESAHSVLRAYLHDQPIPATPRLTRLLELIEEGEDIRWGDIRDEVEANDPLAPREEPSKL